MRYKRTLNLLTLCFILAFASNAYATGESTPPPAVTQPSSAATQPTTTTPTPAPAPASASTTPATSPFAGLVGNDNGMRPIEPLDLDAMGNKAVSFGDKSFAFLQKGSIPLFVWGVGGSVFLMFLGIFFGKRVVLAGVTGVLISLVVVVLIHYMPEIVLSVKGAAGNAISP